MGKGQIFPIKLTSAQNASGNFNSAPVVTLFQDRASVSVNMLTGAVTGAFVLQGRTSFSSGGQSTIQYPHSIGPDSEWVALNNTSQSAPASGSSLSWDISETGYTEVRVQYAYTAGTGSYDIWFAGKRSG